MTRVQQNPRPAEAPGRAKQRRCVLIVHGVGEQKKSDTLLYIGSPQVNWILRWARLFYGDDSTTKVGRVELSFVPYDVGEGDKPPYALLELPDQEWYFAEAWWAGSSYHPSFGTMLWWSLVHLFDILAQMVRATFVRARLVIHPKDMATSSQPARIWQLVDFFNCVVLGLTYAVACLMGYALLVPVMVLAQIPIQSVQDFFLLKVLRPVLTACAGEFRMYLDDELQAANVRRRVAETARALMKLAACDELTIVAHSEGCVVSLGMLTDSTYEDVAVRTRKLFTFGAGLNKSWLIRPTLDRLFAPLQGNILWTDFWASYDPVPAGKLDPGRHKLDDGKSASITDLYQPTDEALEQVGQGKPPVSEQVTNAMNPLTDHGGYFNNDEQVVIRLAAEISAPKHTDSSFWPRESVLLDLVRKRRVRVSALALWRDIAVAFWVFFGFAPWVLGWIQGVDPWEPLSRIKTQVGPAGAILGVLGWLHDSLPPLLAPVSGLAGMLLQLPALLGLALLLGVVVWVIYRLVQWTVWETWDKAARDDFLTQCANSSRERRQAEVPEGSPIPAATI
jgi:hypothetical protein